VTAAAIFAGPFKVESFDASDAKRCAAVELILPDNAVKYSLSSTIIYIIEN
jgi:hypothetical protein